jgi:hypothetical protein
MRGMSVRRRGAVPALAASLVAAISALAAAPAQASFHLMSVREVYPGTAADPNSDYVVLQMYAAGQNFVQGHELTVYNPAGGFATGPNFASNVANGQNQSTILVASPAAAAKFGVTADLALGNDTIDQSGGAVCYGTDQPSPIDCVSWGSFSSFTSPPGGCGGSPPACTGPPAPSFTLNDGMALQRSITPGCPTLLEAGDDTNSSFADFQVVPPNPRNNASPITEKSCAGGGGGGGGGGGDNKPPNTKIGKVKVNGTTATVKFSGTDTARIATASASGLSFKCKLDKKKFKSCKSPKKFKHLKAGKHKVQVEAIDAAGNVDPSPARKKFRV